MKTSWPLSLQTLLLWHPWRECPLRIQLHVCYADDVIWHLSHSLFSSSPSSSLSLTFSSVISTHSLLVGMQNGTATSEDSLTVSYKAKHSLTKWSSSHEPTYLLNWFENFSPQKNLPKNVNSSFIHHHPKLEAAKMSFRRWVYKQKWYNHTMELLSSD